MGAIEGTVKNATNSPIEGVSIVIMAGPSHQDIVSLTDANGNFAISNLRPGNYIIKAYGSSKSDNIPVQVVVHQIAFVEIWLDAQATPSTNLQEQDNNVIDEVNSFEEENNLGLLSTKWKIKSIKPSASKVLSSPKRYILDLTTNNTYSLQLDVNECGGNYRIQENGQITFMGGYCTEMAGDSGFATKLMGLIPGMTHFEVKNNELILKGSGEIILTRYLSF